MMAWAGLQLTGSSFLNQPKSAVGEAFSTGLAQGRDVYGHHQQQDKEGVRYARNCLQKHCKSS